jgi:hypothetical protein
MKVTIKLDVEDIDEAIFRKSLMYFLWNNPASLGVDKIKIGGKEIDFHTERCGYRNSIHMSLKRVEDFKNLIDAYPVVK